MSENCDFCMTHEPGDTLYELSEWDGGIGFDYIRDIHYCPLCGKKLLEWKERKEEEKKKEEKDKEDPKSDPMYPYNILLEKL